jgi:hypothetical protein
MTERQTSGVSYAARRRGVEPAYQHLLSSIEAAEHGDLELLHGLVDRLEVELVIGRLHGAWKHLDRVAAELCDAVLREKIATKKVAARSHHETVTARIKLLISRAKDMLEDSDPRDS